MTQYLLSVHMVEGSPQRSDDDTQQAYADTATLNAEMQEAGAWVFGGGLHEPGTATVVASRDGQVVMTDGPFIEGKEHVGGFWVIEAPDLDAVLAWAKKATVACREPVEVRPFQAEPPV